MVYLFCVYICIYIYIYLYTRYVSHKKVDKFSNRNISKYSAVKFTFVKLLIKTTHLNDTYTILDSIFYQLF